MWFDLGLLSLAYTDNASLKRKNGEMSSELEKLWTVAQQSDLWKKKSSATQQLLE